MAQEKACAAALEAWAAERIGLSELLRQLQAACWSRRQCFAYLEREAEAQGRRQALRSRPRWGRLQNY